MKSLAQIQEEERALKTARMQLEFILANLVHLRKVDRGQKREIAAVRFNEMVERGEELTPNQLSYVDGIYEKTMAGAGMDACDLHVDKKRRTALRYG
jgi:hypothetical protein